MKKQTFIQEEKRPTFEPTDEKAIKNEIIEQIISQERFHIDDVDQDGFKWRGETLLLYLARNSDNSKLFMKIPCHDNAERVVDATYRVHKLIPDKSGLEPVMDENPMIFEAQRKTYKGILLDRARCDLSQYKFTTRRDEELLKIILAAGRGLKKGHDLNIIHKDVKESNIMLYKLGWGMGDWGFSSISNVIDNRNDMSNSIHQFAMYLDYELFHNQHYEERKEERIFDYGSDIFSLGVILFIGTEPGYLSPQKKCENAEVKYTAKWVLQDIERSQRTPDLKRILKRMLGARPQAIAEDKSLIPRYNSLDELFYEARNGSNAKTVPMSDPQFDIYSKENDNFIRLLDKNKYDLDYRGMINNKSIDNIVTAYEKLNHMFNTTSVKNTQDAQRIMGKTFDDYNAVRYDQEQLIIRLRDDLDKRLRKEISKNPNISKEKYIEGLNEYLIFKEKIFLWGPPFTNPNRLNKGEKARYTYDETVKGETFYHKIYKSIINK